MSNDSRVPEAEIRATLASVSSCPVLAITASAIADAAPAFCYFPPGTQRQALPHQGCCSSVRYLEGFSCCSNLGFSSRTWDQFPVESEPRDTCNIPQRLAQKPFSFLFHKPGRCNPSLSWDKAQAPQGPSLPRGEMRGTLPLPFSWCQEFHLASGSSATFPIPSSNNSPGGP